MTQRELYNITIAGLERALPKFEIKPGIKIAILNILGDTELVQACAQQLAQQLTNTPASYLVTAETKSVPLVHAMSVEMKIPYVVLRKAYKPYMGDSLRSETLSITTGAPQSLFLDEKDRNAIANQRVILVDDVISTGSTLQGMRLILQKAEAEVVAEAAILTEGDRAKWHDVVALGHLPVWIDE